MKKNLLKYTLSVTICIIGISAISTTPTFADDPCNTSLPDTVREANGCNNNSKNQLPDIITGIINAVIAVSGLVAVIYIIVGGVNYMTSNGDSTKIQKAKTTILYALIGLVICALSFAIVNWVILRAIGGQSSAPAQQQNTSQLIEEKPIAFVEK